MQLKAANRREGRGACGPLCLRLDHLCRPLNRLTLSSLFAASPPFAAFSLLAAFSLAGLSVFGLSVCRMGQRGSQCAEGCLEVLDDDDNGLGVDPEDEVVYIAQQGTRHSPGPGLTTSSNGSLSSGSRSVTPYHPFQRRRGSTPAMPPSTWRHERPLARAFLLPDHKQAGHELQSIVERPPAPAPPKSKSSIFPVAGPPIAPPLALQQDARQQPVATPQGARQQPPAPPPAPPLAPPPAPQQGARQQPVAPQQGPLPAQPILMALRVLQSPPMKPAAPVVTVQRGTAMVEDSKWDRIPAPQTDIDRRAILYNVILASPLDAARGSSTVSPSAIQP